MRSSKDVDAAPLVSVIVPSYNHAGYIEQAICSVLAQSYKSVQLVVIDDGSTDGSAEVLAGLADRLGFRLICQENRGVCRALNRAIREWSDGEYIALLGSDDVWHPDKLRLQLEALSGDPASEFCYAQAREFHDDAQLNTGRVFPVRCHRGRVVEKVFIRQHVPAGTMLFSRRLYEHLGGFDESLLEEDWDFVIRSAAATSFAAVTKPLLYYRTHAANTMKTRSRKAIFHQKAKILAKNFPLVPPRIWLSANVLHYFYDIILGRFRR